MFNPVYPEIKYYLSSVDISQYVVSTLGSEGSSGIFSYKDVDRTATSGNLSFDLNNDSGTFSDVSSLRDKTIRATISLGVYEKQIWFGYIEKADFDSGDFGTRRIHISASDWIKSANELKVKNLPLTLNVTADTAITTLVGTMPVQPAYVNFDVGTEVFPGVYDSVKENTVVLSEADRIVKSELGYLYQRYRDKSEGETLRFENNAARSSTKPITEIPEKVTTRFHIKYSTPSGGGLIKYNNGTDSGNIAFPTFQQLIFDRTMVDSHWSSGENLITEFTTTIVPRRLETAYGDVFVLDAPLLLSPAERVTNEIQGSFSSQLASSASVTSVYDVLTPVQGVDTFTPNDYLCSENNDGTGTNYTANVTIKSFEYGTNNFTIRFRNEGPPCFLWYFRIQGKAIYKFNSVDLTSTDTEETSGAKIIKTGSINREYSNQRDTSKAFSDNVIAINRKKRKIMESVSFVANADESLMIAFMYLDIGDKVKIIDNQPDHTGLYYIQGIRFRIEGRIVYFTWYLKEAIETVCQPIAVRCGTNIAGNESALDFGVMPHLANMSQFSYSLWVKRLAATTFAVLISKTIDTGSGRRGNFLLLNTNGDLQFISYKTPTDGDWSKNLALYPSYLDWRHVALTYDNTTDTADPLLYIDGVLTAMTETGTPTGTSDDDRDAPLILFNMTPDPLNPAETYSYNTLHDVLMKNVRIYNRILSQTEITALAASADDYLIIQEGLVFQGIYAPQDNIDDYINDMILADDLVLETVRGYAGRPYNTDTSSSTETLYGLTP